MDPNSKDQVDIIELTIPCKSEYVGVARLAISGIASRMAFSYDDIEDIKIAVGEACINSIKHAYPPSKLEKKEDNKILIKCATYQSKIDIIVKDQGIGFKYLEVKPDEKKDIPSKNGLGIFLMKSLMDDVSYNPNLNRGTEVHMTKYLMTNVNQ